MAKVLSLLTADKVRTCLGEQSVDIVGRETLWEREFKRVERIEIRRRGNRRVTVVAKYGRSCELVREHSFYAQFVQNLEGHAPKLIGQECGPDGVVMLLEHIDGAHPDYSMREDVERVFGVLGRLAGNSTRRMCSFGIAALAALPHSGAN